LKFVRASTVNWSKVAKIEEHDVKLKVIF